MKLNNNQDTQTDSLPEIKNKKILVKNSKKTSQLLFIFIGSFCLFLLANQAIWAQIESIYNSTTDEVAGISGLMSAVTNNDIEGVKFFSKGGPLIINQKNLGGATALHIACRESNAEAVKILLENGASVNISDNEGWTPLMRASLAGNVQIVEMLITKNAKADAFNSIGETAIVHATSSRCLDCLNIIIEKANLVKTANLKTLKTQITDAFLLARNQEDSNIKTVLEAFLDYVNKADNLLTAQIIESKPSESLPDSSLEEDKIEPIKKLTINKKAGKKFALKVSQEQQEEAENVIKLNKIQNKPIETPKIIQTNEKSVKQAKLEPEQKNVSQNSESVSQVVKFTKITEKPKKSFKLKRPIEDEKNKIPTFTQKSLPPVVSPIKQESSVNVISSEISVDSNLDKQEKLQNNNETNEDKSKQIIASAEILPADNSKETKVGFFKKLFSKKPITQLVNNDQLQSLQDQNAKTQPLLKKPLDIENSSDYSKNSPEKSLEESPSVKLDSLQLKPEEVIKNKPEINHDHIQNKLPKAVKSDNNDLSNNKENKNIKIINQAQPKEKLKKFKFSPMQDSKNNSVSTKTISQDLPQKNESKNNINTSQKTSLSDNSETLSVNLKESSKKEYQKRKYKLKAITESENNEPEVEIKKLPVPQEI